MKGKSTKHTVDKVFVDTNAALVDTTMLAHPSPKAPIAITTLFRLRSRGGARALEARQFMVFVDQKPLMFTTDAVEDINRRSELGNLTLRYHILDSCSDVAIALEQTLSFMDSRECHSQKRGYGSMDGRESPSPPVMAVIGGYYSEISIAVARQLNMEHIPQISYGSTSGTLSDKNRFPNFMRTVAEDDHQAQAIVQILKVHKWTWVGVVTTDGDYGHYAVHRFQHHATQNKICLAFTSVLTDILGDNQLMDQINATVKKIIKNTNVKVIVSFARPGHMKLLFSSLLRHPGGRGKVWVASETWSESHHVLQNWTLSDVGTIIGITFQSGNVSRFLQYLSNLNVYPDHHKNNSFLHRVANRDKPGNSANELPKQNTSPYTVFSIELAVKAIAQAVADLCAGRDCKTRKKLQPLEGDVFSQCSNSCIPGYRKKVILDEFFCCYECIACPENHFSNVTDAAECHRCATDSHYSVIGSADCTKKKTVYLDWKDFYCDLLLAVAALGVLLTLVIGILFITYWNTPVVRASVRPISLLLLLSLLGTFVSVVLFGGIPTREKCQAQQVLFALSFTLCVSCILVKSFKIILAFEFKPRVHGLMKRLYNPYVTIAVCMLLQVVICVFWMVFRSPSPKLEKLNDKELVIKCDEGSLGAYRAMLSYIGLLALIGLVFAFKGRKLPHSFNEAKFITFGMLIYFLCWIIFGPVHVNIKGRYLPAVKMIVILISAYGILFCHFLPKCYIILFKQEENTKHAFQQDIKSFSFGDKGLFGLWRNGHYLPVSGSIKEPPSAPVTPALGFPQGEGQGLVTLACRK
ncbi:G-protein coupled receptor family C group 6 member A-like [Lampris incognitus]|uniref:G-protein coupled receptor family C group 6 member A-like n=1 Tax=Lampris incognitus TaxID=2546036 RepID=UPI0024B5D543|nr:G-protein coupled receptor family C group 6 member A-like [Lampris incognitus]